MHHLLKTILAFCMIGFATTAAAQDLDISEIMTAKAAYDESKTEARRAALLLALETYQGDATVETVNASLMLMSDDMATRDYAKIRSSANTARAHLEPVQAIIPEQYIYSRFVAATATFNDALEPEAMREMAHVQGFSNQFRDSENLHPQWAIDLKWKAEAWGMAMDAYFASTRAKHPSEDEIDAILAEYPIAEAAIIPVAEDAMSEARLPLCEGRIIQTPKMRYPARAARKGVVGAVIIGFDLDVEGNVIQPKVLASIPTEGFDEAILKTISKWRYRADKRKQVGVTCGLQRTNVVMPFMFSLP